MKAEKKIHVTAANEQDKKAASEYEKVLNHWAEENPETFQEIVNNAYTDFLLYGTKGRP